MHIALVNQWYPPETGGGGVASHNYHFANACVQMGHQVTVIANRPTPDASAERTLNGVTVRRILTPSFYRLRRLPLIGRQYRFVQALVYSRMACNALAALNQEHPVDVAEFAEVNAEGFFWRPSMSKRMVVRCHTPAWVLVRYYIGDEAPYAANLLGWAEKRVIRRAHGLTSPSQDMANVIARDSGIQVDRILPIPNAIDIDEYTPAQTQPNSDRINILWVGRLERAKGIEVLIEAIPLVCQRVSNVRFVVIGGSRPRPQGGNYIDYMKEHFADHLAAGQLEVRGFIPDADLLNAYHQSHISIVPSVLYESFSFTVAQSMSCGLPVVASRIGGIPETLADGQCGVLTTPGDAKELAETLIALVQNPAQREQLGRAGRQRAVSMFSREAVAKLMVEFYDRILKTD